MNAVDELELERQQEAYVAGHMVSLVSVLHGARADVAAARRIDESATRELKGYLGARPEGERELWDNEPTPPIGVGLVDGGGRRWLDWAVLSDEAIVYAARNGCLALAAGDYDAARKHAQATGDLDAIEWLAAVGAGVREGGGESLVLLPRSRS